MDMDYSFAIMLAYFFIWVGGYIIKEAFDDFNCISATFACDESRSTRVKIIILWDNFSY